MSVNGKFVDIRKEDCLALANRFGIGEAPSVLQAVRGAVEHWPKLAKEAGVQTDDVRRIRERFTFL